MAYWFNGFFAKGTFKPPVDLRDGVVWRAISTPFIGVGVRISPSTNKSPDAAEIGRLRREVGLDAASDWIYLTYVCWAGKIDFIYGLGVVDGRTICTATEDDEDKAKAVYLAFMGKFGVSPSDALQFPPFVRGFWGVD